MTNVKKSLIGRLSVAAVALVFCGAAQNARADFLNVNYYTVGTFDTSTVNLGISGFVSLTGNNTSSITLTGFGGGSVTLAFLAAPAHTETLLGPSGGAVTFIGASLGSFSLTGSGSGFGSAQPITFNLGVYQNLPTPAGTVGTFVGSVQVGITLTQDGAAINFPAFPANTQTSISVPPVSYSMNPTVYTLANPPLAGAISTTTVKADLFSPAGVAGSPTPLPAIASTGMTMFALLGAGLAGRKLSRRRPVNA